MKPPLAIRIAAATALSASALAQTTPQILRTQTAFELTVPLPYAETAPLFGPEGERVWAGKHWNPQFLYPQTPHDEQGATRGIAFLPEMRTAQAGRLGLF